MEFDAAAIGEEAEDVSGVDFHFGSGIAGFGGAEVFGADFEVAFVAEAVGGVDPAIGGEAEAGAVAVDVAFPAEGAEEDGAFVADAVAIGIVEEPDVRDAPCDAAGFVGDDAGGDVEAIGKDGAFVGAAVLVGVFEDDDGVLAIADAGALRVFPAIAWGGVWIFVAAGNPCAAFFVEGDVHGFVDLGFCGEELDVEAGGEFEVGALLFRGEWFGGADE